MLWTTQVTKDSFVPILSVNYTTKGIFVYSKLGQWPILIIFVWNTRNRWIIKHSCGFYFFCTSRLLSHRIAKYTLKVSVYSELMTWELFFAILLRHFVALMVQRRSLSFLGRLCERWRAWEQIIYDKNTWRVLHVNEDTRRILSRQQFEIWATIIGITCSRVTKSHIGKIFPTKLK